MREKCKQHQQTRFTSYEEAVQAAGTRNVRIKHLESCDSWHISTRGGNRSQRRRRTGGQ